MCDHKLGCHEGHLRCTLRCWWSHVTCAPRADGGFLTRRRICEVLQPRRVWHTPSHQILQFMFKFCEMHTSASLCLRTCSLALRILHFPLSSTLLQVQVATLGDLEQLTQSPCQCPTSFKEVSFSNGSAEILDGYISSDCSHDQTRIRNMRVKHPGQLSW